MKRVIIVIGLLLFMAAIAFFYLYWPYSKIVIPSLAARLPSRLSRPVLVALLDSSDEIVAQGAAWHLGEIGGADSYDPLIRAISNPIPMVRHNAINAMIHLRQADMAFMPTIKNVDNPQEEIFVLDSAMTLLTQLRNPQHKETAIASLKRLQGRLNNENQKARVAQAIKQIENQ